MRTPHREKNCEVCDCESCTCPRIDSPGDQLVTDPDLRNATGPLPPMDRCTCDEDDPSPCLCYEC
jgi:hypothetical protein